MAQTNRKPFIEGICHSRSLSQPTFFANKCLSPVSPPIESPPNLNLNLKNLSMDELHANGLSSPRLNPFLPPPRAHHRSNSDIPLGFSSIIRSSPHLVPISSQESLRDNTRHDKSSIGIKMEGEVVDHMLDSFMDLDGLGGFNSITDGKDKNTSYSVTKMNYCSNGVKRNAGGDIGNFQPLCIGAAQLSPTVDFGHAEFNELELKKIMGDERLAEIAISDPKRVKRILANRQSAARSKERKMHYISELEHKVKTLQTEATALSVQLTVLQNDNTELTNQNHELKFRIQAMQQQAKLGDALHETLMVEVERLKVANMDFRCNEIEQPIKHLLFPLQPK